jgi:hypothetical protein
MPERPFVESKGWNSRSRMKASSMPQPSSSTSTIPIGTADKGHIDAPALSGGLLGVLYDVSEDRGQAFRIRGNGNRDIGIDPQAGTGLNRASIGNDAFERCPQIDPCRVTGARGGA